MVLGKITEAGPITYHISSSQGLSTMITGMTEIETMSRDSWESDFIIGQCLFP